VKRIEALLQTGYQEIAHEYYSRPRHPTCANFRDASVLLIRTWLGESEAAKKRAIAVEVGAGKSVLAELAKKRAIQFDLLILTDLIRSMIAHSARWASGDVRLLVADASSLPIASGLVDLLVSSLGDPYNIPTFWDEVYRVLRPGGLCIFTTPSYEWASQFRSDGDKARAEFEIMGGGRVLVESRIYASAEQVAMIEKAGLQVGKRDVVRVAAFRPEALSSKILDRSPSSAVVQGYLLAKPQS
jgi:SAM-dependent methyltransferase